MSYQELSSAFIKNYETAIEVTITVIFLISCLLYVYYRKPAFFNKIKQGLKIFFVACHFAQQHTALWFFAAAKNGLITATITALVVLKQYNVISIDIFADVSVPEHLPVSTIAKELFFIALVWVVVGYINSLIDLSAVWYTLKCLHKEPATIRGAFLHACSRSWLVFKFFLLDYLVAIITRNKKAESSRLSFINLILKSIMGLTWSLATYFIMPVIAQERLTLKESIKESATIMKDHFGNLIGFEFGTRLLFIPAGCMMLLGLITVGVGLLIQNTYGIQSFFLVSIFLGELILTLLLLLGAITVTMITKWIFTCAAYNYARGTNTGPFDEHLIVATIIKK